MKRAFITIAALLMCGAIGSAARAQTPAHAANFNRYLSNHPGVAQQFAANPGTINAPSYMTGYPGAQNYSSAYQTQYMKNLATYQNYLATHPGLAANQGMGNVLPYMANYPGQYPYPDPTQQPAGSPMMALIAPFMSGNPALQNYGGGYGGAPMYQPPYAGNSYPPPEQWGDDDDGDHHWHHHHFDGDGYGPYGSGGYGPYGGGAGPYNSGGYEPYSGAPISHAWNHHHFAGNFGPAAPLRGPRFFGTNPGASRAWSSHPFAMGRGRSWGRNH